MRHAWSTLDLIGAEVGMNPCVFGTDAKCFPKLFLQILEIGNLPATWGSFRLIGGSDVRCCAHFLEFGFAAGRVTNTWTSTPETVSG